MWSDLAGIFWANKSRKFVGHSRWLSSVIYRRQSEVIQNEFGLQTHHAELAERRPETALAGACQRLPAYLKR